MLIVESIAAARIDIAKRLAALFAASVLRRMLFEDRRLICMGTLSGTVGGI
jgi:hypothetical protein